MWCSTLDDGIQLIIGIWWICSVHIESLLYACKTREQWGALRYKYVLRRKAPPHIHTLRQLPAWTEYFLHHPSFWLAIVWLVFVLQDMHSAFLGIFLCFHASIGYASNCYPWFSPFLVPRREILHSYGFEHLSSLYNLEKAGLFKRQVSWFPSGAVCSLFFFWSRLIFCSINCVLLHYVLNFLHTVVLCRKQEVTGLLLQELCSL